MKKVICILAVFLFLVSCDEKENQADPDLNFSKVIGSTTFEGDFYPWDIVETSDQGLLSLSSTNTTSLKNIHILKVDNAGEFEWEINDSSNFKNALPKIIEQNGQYYIFAMHGVTLNTHLLQIDIENKVLVEVNVYNDFFYPTAVAEVPNGYIVQCFDRDAQRIRLMKLNNGFAEQWRERYSVYEDPIEFNSHLLQTDPLPFFCGHVGTDVSASRYFVGGMYNFTLNTLFVNVNDGSIHKRITGFRYEAGVSALLNIKNEEFFMVKHNLVGENSVLTNFDIDLGTGTTLNSQNTDDVPDNIDLELPIRVKTVLKKMTINGKDVVVQITNTKRQETLINFYNYEGNLIGSKRIGSESPYFCGNITNTSDGGLAILCQTLISGRISRLAIIKISEEEVAALF